MKSLAKVFRRIPFNSPFYFSSKKWKQKIIDDAKKEQQLNNQLNPPINPMEQLVGKLTLAEKARMDIATQMAPIGLLFMNCILFADDPFCKTYQYSMLAGEKFTSLLVLTNINYPQNVYLKYAMIGGVIATNFIPILSIYSPIVQIIQFLLIINNDKKKIKEGTRLTPQIQLFMAQRLKMKLALYMALVFILFFKAQYHYECYQMEKLIDKLNGINRGDLPPIAVSPQ